MGRCILAVDQSTQGTKGLLFDQNGRLLARADRAHRQIVNEKGWVEHDPREILQNTLAVCREVVAKAGVSPDSLAAMGISNQRETSLMWDAATGEPLYNAVVWQCARAVEICERPAIAGQAESIRKKTGLILSPYFPAAKLCWLMENLPRARALARQGRLACGTVDSWLLYCLCAGHPHKTDYSNASRTQLFNLTKLCWDEELCELFGIPAASLPEVCFSDSAFGRTDLGGFLAQPIPIHGVLGDSHGALLGHGGRSPGSLKVTYGTGSSVMLNVGAAPVFSQRGLASSIAWGLEGRIDYVLEGYLNYTGAVLAWLKNEVGLIQTEAETATLAQAANPEDKTCFVPAFTGLGAPYWEGRATGLLTGITRTTGKNEIVKACLDCIAHQITDLLELMRADSGIGIDALRVDGGPTANCYLMQRQADLADAPVWVPDLQELSGMGAAYAAGIAVGLYDRERIFAQIQYTRYHPRMAAERREQLRCLWQDAIARTLYHPPGR